MDNREIIKIIGLKDKIKFDDLENLLIKDNNLEVNQKKWYRDFSLAKITIKDELYTVMVTDNKRKTIYKNNKFIDTSPIYIDNEKIIQNPQIC